jgi:hypothetical protein
MDFGYRDLFAHMLKPKSLPRLVSRSDEKVLGETPTTGRRFDIFKVEQRNVLTFAKNKI